MATKPMRTLQRRPIVDSSGNMTGVAALFASTRSLVFDHPEKALKSSQPSVLKAYLQVPQDDSKRMIASELWIECFNLTFAGPGSTAAGLTTILYMLGTPLGVPWQYRILEEVSPAILTAVIKELMRMNAPFPTAFPRTIRPGAETAIPDLQAPLPAGTIVSANPYILGRSKEIWGEDADEWKPERWLGPEDEQRKAEDRFVAFGKGARGCLGREIAMLIISQAILAILQKWKIEAKGNLRGSALVEMQYSNCELVLLERKTYLGTSLAMRWRLSWKLRYAQRCLGPGKQKKSISTWAWKNGVTTESCKKDIFLAFRHTHYGDILCKANAYENEVIENHLMNNVRKV